VFFSEHSVVIVTQRRTIQCHRYSRAL